MPEEGVSNVDGYLPASVTSSPYIQRVPNEAPRIFRERQVDQALGAAHTTYKAAKSVQPNANVRPIPMSDVVDRSGIGGVDVLHGEAFA
jgi:hypothetical protein